VALQTIDEFAASLERVGTTMNGVQDAALHKCIPLVRARIQRNYDEGGTADGQAWPAHAPSTVKRYGPHPLLILTGKMKAATLDPGSGHIENITGGTLTFGVSGDLPEHPWVHQEGSKDGRVPQRQFVALDNETVDKCVELIADDLLSVFKGN
jgi:hypothetical protein